MQDTILKEVRENRREQRGRCWLWRLHNLRKRLVEQHNFVPQGFSGKAKQWTHGKLNLRRPPVCSRSLQGWLSDYTDVFGRPGSIIKVRTLRGNGICVDKFKPESYGLASWEQVQKVRPWEGSGERRGQRKHLEKWGEAAGDMAEALIRMTGERRCKMFWHRTAGTFHVKRSLRGTGHGHLFWGWHWQPGQLGRWRRQVGTGFPLKKRATADSGSWRSNVKEQKTNSSYWAISENVSLRVLSFFIITTAGWVRLSFQKVLSESSLPRAFAEAIGLPVLPSL